MTHIGGVLQLVILIVSFFIVKKAKLKVSVYKKHSLRKRCISRWSFAPVQTSWSDHKWSAPSSGSSSLMPLFNVSWDRIPQTTCGGGAAHVWPHSIVLCEHKPVRGHMWRTTCSAVSPSESLDPGVTADCVLSQSQMLVGVIGFLDQWL